MIDIAYLNPPIPLSRREEKLLADMEGVVSRNLKALYEVGMALATIRDKQLYRVSHKTFQSYCKEKWDFGSRQAYRYISAAEVVENVTNWSQNNVEINASGAEKVLPLNESHTRPLAKIPPEDQGKVW